MPKYDRFSIDSIIDFCFFQVGACCVVALITDRSVIVANAGDCRAVLGDGSVAHPLSEPHR